MPRLKQKRVQHPVSKRPVKAKTFWIQVLCLTVLLFTLCLLDTGYWTLDAAFGDVIYFKSGQTLKGLVVEEHRDRVILSTEGGEQAVWRSDIDEIFYDDPERNYLYLGHQALEGGNAPLAKGFFRKALQIRSDFQDAEDALGFVADLEAKQAVPLSPSLSPVELLEKKWGLTLETASDRPLVRRIQLGSLVERMGVKAGDFLVSAWGESLSFVPLAEAAKALLGPQGSPLKLTLERKVDLLPGPDQWPGAALSIERLGLTVKEVSPKGAFSRAGMRSQDRIVRIGTFSTRYLPLEEAREKMKRAREQGIGITIHRDLFIKRE